MASRSHASTGSTLAARGHLVTAKTSWSLVDDLGRSPRPTQDLRSRQFVCSQTKAEKLNFGTGACKSVV
jgi:hypothetical protein